MTINTTLMESLERLVESKLNNVFTTLPAKVTQVDYTKNQVTIKPLLKTKRQNDEQAVFPEIPNVPIFVLSSGRGSARITLPVAVGDTVLVLFASRSLGEFLKSTADSPSDTSSRIPLGPYPIAALPCIFTEATAKEIDSTNVIIENESSKVTISPSGDITIDAPSTCTINSVQTTINSNLSVNGNVDITGDVEVTGGLTNNSVDVGSTHIHTGVVPGGGLSGIPNVI